MTNVCLDMRCFAEPRTSGQAKQPRCADGKTYSAGWTKCRDNGSVRIQCPKSHYPCEALTGSAELPEFKCGTACADTVRAQQCQGIGQQHQENIIVKMIIYSYVQRCAVLLSPGMTTSCCVLMGTPAPSGPDVLIGAVSASSAPRTSTPATT